MSEGKAYQRKGHVHLDTKKETKKSGANELQGWYCLSCTDYTKHDTNYSCDKCGGRMIWV